MTHRLHSDTGNPIAAPSRRMTLTAMEFIRRFLQHVLPDGFHKVRYYGLLSPSNRKTLKILQNVLTTNSVLESILRPSDTGKTLRPAKTRNPSLPTLRREPEAAQNHEAGSHQGASMKTNKSLKQVPRPKRKTPVSRQCFPVLSFNRSSYELGNDL